MRTLRQIFIPVFIIVGIYWLVTRKIVPAMKNQFASKPVIIDETPILIKEIRSIGQLITYTSYNEVVADTVIKTKGSAFVNSFNRMTRVRLLPSADKQLVLIGRGRIMAGTDLKKLTDTSISISKDTIKLYLPQTQILDAILNPTDFETFVEKGEWSNEETILVKAQARRKMIERALQQNLIPKANDKAKIIMENFLHNMGYKHVLVF